MLTRARYYSPLHSEDDDSAITTQGESELSLSPKAVVEAEKASAQMLSTHKVTQLLKDGNTFKNRVFEIRHSSIGGLGAFATSTLRKGDIILVEKPLFVSDELNLYRDFESLNHETQRVSLGLHRNELLKEGTPDVKAVWSTNRFVQSSSGSPKLVSFFPWKLGRNLCGSLAKSLRLL